jgi:hypothetical protein
MIPSGDGRNLYYGVHNPTICVHPLHFFCWNKLSISDASSGSCPGGVETSSDIAYQGRCFLMFIEMAAVKQITAFSIERRDPNDLLDAPSGC